MLRPDKIERFTRAIMREIEHDCQGCYAIFIRNITQAQVEVGGEIIAWDAKVDKGTQFIELVFADKEGKIVEIISLERPNH